MSDLAFNLNGDPFEVPANAIGWRVRRMKAKGAPEVVYGRNGQPLVLPVESDLDDVRAEVSAPGRYRFDPVDDTNKPIDGSPAGYAFVHDQTTPAMQPSGVQLRSASDNIVIEAMRMNAEISRAVVDKFPMMLEAAATLLRAADGAGLPAREPRATDEEGGDAGDDEEAPSQSGFDLTAMVAQLLPVLMMSFGKGKSKIPLASVLDWRKAASAGKSTPPESTKEDIGAATPAIELPPIDPQMMAHFIAIQSALDPEEAALARNVASELSPAELRAWFDELGKLSVPDAVAKIRGLIGKGGVS